MSDKQKLTVLIGHRGVGKTSLLMRLSQYYKELKIDGKFYDLDQYIESNSSRKIADIFKNEGEVKFRKIEAESFKDILVELKNENIDKVFISVGAGFMGPFPDACDVVFIRRDTDKKGRIFLERPRLLKEVSAFDESLVKYKDRQKKYENIATKVLTLEDGGFSGVTYEKSFFGLNKVNCEVTYTLQKKDINNIEFYNSLGISQFELRTDLFNINEISAISKNINHEKILIALRENNQSVNDEILNNEQLRLCKFDYALELGSTDKIFNIISTHKRLKTIDLTIEKLEKYKEQCEILKLAIPINNFEELEIAHKWHAANPEKNVFLPMSKDGRWQWYRLLMHSKLRLNFLKFDEKGSSLDQPYYYQLIKNIKNKDNGFSCILGDSIEHSYTPSFHHQYFSKFKMPVLNISVKKDELTNDVLNFLKNLGLKAAAVTSPLKIKMKILLNIDDFESINTICLSDNKYVATNTDGYGLKKLLSHIDSSVQQSVLWGGGGVISEIEKMGLTISMYSAREKAPRIGNKQLKKPKYLIWAVGRKQHMHWPPEDWSPEVIIDLNYSEDSPGKEYAIMIGAKYINGQEMFVEQALEQQKFWDKYL